MKGTTQVPSVYVLLRRGGKLAFVLRTHTGFMDGAYSLPAGHVEDGETFREAAIREAFEETGVKVNIDDLKYLHTMQRNRGDHVRVDVFFEAAKWEGEPTNAEPELHGELTWFLADGLPYEDIMDYQGEALRQIAAGKQYSEFGWDNK